MKGFCRQTSITRLFSRGPFHRILCSTEEWLEQVTARVTTSSVHVYTFTYRRPAPYLVLRLDVGRRQTREGLLGTKARIPGVGDARTRIMPASLSRPSFFLPLARTRRVVLPRRFQGQKLGWELPVMGHSQGPGRASKNQG